MSDKKDKRVRHDAKQASKAVAKQASKAAGRPSKAAARDATRRASGPRLPQSRVELLALHRETRARRNAAAHSSPDHVEAVDLLGRIEIEIARIERAMDPPLV